MAKKIHPSDMRRIVCIHGQKQLGYHDAGSTVECPVCGEDAYHYIQCWSGYLMCTHCMRAGASLPMPEVLEGGIKPGDRATHCLLMAIHNKMKYVPKHEPKLRLVDKDDDDPPPTGMAAAA